MSQPETAGSASSTKTLAAVSFALLAPFTSLAQDSLYELCPLLLFERESELDELQLAIQLDETRLALAEEIFVLQNGLWKNDMVERLTYLEAKHHRDVAAVSLERARWRLERQQAVVRQFRLGCAGVSEEDKAQQRTLAIKEAHRRYLAADCEVRALDVAVVEVNLGHHQEDLRSVINLQQNDIASREQVMFAERDVEMLIEQLEQARQRTEHCPAAEIRLAPVP